MNYAEKLRALADYLDEHPTLRDRFSSYSEPRERIYANDWDDFQSLIVHLDGFQKDGYGGSLEATHKESDPEDDNRYNYAFVVTVAVSEVCEMVPKVDENGEPVMREKKEFVPTGEYEPVMEYKCPKVWTA